MQDYSLSGAKDRGERRRTSRLASHPLLSVLLLVAVLAPCPLRAQSNTAKATPSSQRWLLIVETSRSMQRRADAVLETVQELLASGMASQLRPGDTLGVWTYTDDLSTRRFPLQRWSPEARQDIATRTVAFLKGQKYEKQANYDKVLPVLDKLIKDSQHLTVVLISSGEEKMRGTPFDAQINEFYQKWREQQQKGRMPFVTVLRASAGQLADYTVNTPPFPTQIPHPLQQAPSVEPIQEKLLEAVRSPPPPAVPPLIISGKKPPPEPLPAPKPEPAVVKVAAPAASAAAPGTNNLVLAKPPAPVAPPVEVAKTDAVPATPAKPPPGNAPNPPLAPVPATEPKAEVVKVPETKPVEPPPAKPEAVPALPTPAPKPQPVASEPPKPVAAPESKPVLAPAPVVAPPATREPSVATGPPRPAPRAPLSSSLSTASAQTATAVPAANLVRRTSIWIAGLVLAGVAAGFGALLLRRSRPAPGGSLITRSFERKHKP